MATTNPPVRLSRADRVRAFRQTQLIPIVCQVFETLGIAATMWIDGQWSPIHEQQSVVTVELEYGAFPARVTYNKQCLTRARRTAATVLGEHGGLSDLFVPVVVDGEVRAFIIVGPFFRKRPTAPDVLSRWRELTGRQGHPADPEFSRYVDVVLSTLVLDGAQLEAFTETVERLAALVSLGGTIVNARSEALALNNKVKSARHVEHVWAVAGAMIDERSSRAWQGRNARVQRRELGLSGSPDQIAVGLFADRDDAMDPVGSLFCRRELQRLCVELCLAKGNLLSGRLGDHGVTLLAVSKKSSERTRSSIGALTDRIGSHARELGLAMHWGLSKRSAPLHEQYRVALAAAGSALARGARLVVSEGSEPVRLGFGQLGRDLARLAEEKPRSLPVRFEALLEAVASKSGHRLETAQAYLEAGFDQFVEALATSGKLEDAAARAVRSALGRAVDEADTIQDLFVIYRRVMQEVVRAVQEPTLARHDRGLSRAEQYLGAHYAEAITLVQVARVAGFAPAYFSRLFRAHHGVTFVHYVQRLRVERAKQLLSDGSLSLQRIADLTGLSNRHYLNRVFKRVTGQTPIAYREKRRRSSRASTPASLRRRPGQIQNPKIT